MKFGNKKVVATIVVVAMATTLAGCSKDENNSVQSDSDTEKDLLTSSSSIDIWSAPESIDSSLNSYDTSKPIEKDENPAGEASSDDENPTGDLTDDGTSESGTSDGETSKPSDNTTSVPSDSSLTDETSESETSKNDKSDNSESSTTSNIYSNLPEGWIPSGAGQAGTCTEEEYEAMIEANRRDEEAIKNGTYGKVTSDQAAELDKIFFS